MRGLKLISNLFYFIHKFETIFNSRSLGGKSTNKQKIFWPPKIVPFPSNIIMYILSLSWRAQVAIKERLAQQCESYRDTRFASDFGRLHFRHYSSLKISLIIAQTFVGFQFYCFVHPTLLIVHRLHRVIQTWTVGSWVSVTSQKKTRCHLHSQHPPPKDLTSGTKLRTEQKKLLAFQFKYLFLITKNKLAFTTFGLLKS